jgi:hypothetical protein
VEGLFLAAMRIALKPLQALIKALSLATRLASAGHLFCVYFTPALQTMMRPFLCHFSVPSVALRPAFKQP